MTEWTARICVALWLATLFVRPQSRAAKSERVVDWWRVLWTLGAVSLAVHTAAAFHCKHDWSHAHAYAHTAQQTLDTVGLDWGGGLYFNYLTSIWWLLDAIAIWLKIDWARKKSYRLALEWYLAFMFLNATIVFGPRFWVAAGIGVLGSLAWLAKRKRSQLPTTNVEVDSENR